MESILKPSTNVIRRAAKALIEGHLVGFPTETVYGLGSDAENAKAVKSIYAAKGRPSNHPIIVHISTANYLSRWAINIPDYAYVLAEKFWPGPMTLILEKSEKAKDFITGGQKSVGLRVPNHPVALNLLKEFEKIGGSGIAAPSANRFGAVSPTTSRAVVNSIGSCLSDKDLILDGGNCKIGIESTIINCLALNPYILRPGAITEEMLTNVAPLEAKPSFKTRTSGYFKNHYAPNARVFLDVQPNIGDGFIALKEIPTPHGAIRLASPKDLQEFAFLLYDSFRQADNLGIESVCVSTPPKIGIGVAIIDRLNKSRYRN